ncbi:MAG: methylmalonyl Co-A mutase-associated GTPase MeaB, partial [Ginsengibacter sp.]
EVDIAALADITVVVLVPESGDAIQSMKAGLMEIADIFLVNKSDRPDADKFYHNLCKMIAPAFRSSEKKVPVLKTVATQKEGIGKLYETIVEMMPQLSGETKADLLLEKVWSIIQDRKMKGIDKVKLRQAILDVATSRDFNLYQFADDYLRTH